MQPPPPPSARLHVVRGSDPQRILFHAARPVALTVGSAAFAQLQLRAACVAPRQFDAVWDGSAFWLQDTLRLGRTLVNGQPLNEWVLVRGEVLVSFGTVRIWIAARSPNPVPSCPDFASLERACCGQQASATVRRSPTMRMSLTPAASELLSEAAGS